MLLSPCAEIYVKGNAYFWNRRAMFRSFWVLMKSDQRLVERNAQIWRTSTNKRDHVRGPNTLLLSFEHTCDNAIIVISNRRKCDVCEYPSCSNHEKAILTEAGRYNNLGLYNRAGHETKQFHLASTVINHKVLGEVRCSMQAIMFSKRFPAIRWESNLPLKHSPHITHAKSGSRKRNHQNHVLNII